MFFYFPRTATEVHHFFFFPRTAVEVHYFFFARFPQFWELKTPPKTDWEKEKKNCYRWMKNRMAEVHNENHANKKWPIIYFFSDVRWVKEPRHSEKQNSKKKGIPLL